MVAEAGADSSAELSSENTSDAHYHSAERNAGPTNSEHAVDPQLAQTLKPTGVYTAVKFRVLFKAIGS